MHSITKIQTFDGAEHNDSKAAYKHLENIIGHIVSKHAHKICVMLKYTEVVKYLEDNFMDFQTAIDAKKDMEFTYEAD